MNVEAPILEGHGGLLLHSLEKVLDRAEESYHSLQTRINTVITSSVGITVALMTILGLVAKFAETSDAWRLAVMYVPWAGLFSAFLAWRFARGIRRELLTTLAEARTVERERNDIVKVPVMPFTRRLQQEVSFWGINRETYVVLVIAVLWAGYLVHAHSLVQLLTTLFLTR